MLKQSPTHRLKKNQFRGRAKFTQQWIVDLPSVKLSRMASKPSKNQRKQKLTTSNSNSSGTSSVVGLSQLPAGLSELPVELINCIFDNLHIYDVITTGLLARRLWKFARRHIAAYYISRYGRWAGQNIVCVGECLSDMA